MATHVLWLKRDLRLTDHKPLQMARDQACALGHQCLIIYIFEPIVENNYDFDLRHWQFAYQCLAKLQATLPIHLLYGDALEIFTHLTEQHQLTAVYSHQETGNDTTFKRDLALARYFKEHHISWREEQANGVVRGLSNRKTWDAAWIKHMSGPIVPNHVSAQDFTSHHSIAKDFALPLRLDQAIQNNPFHEGGSHCPRQLLNDFINDKVEHYFRSLSYPDSSRYHCSRLSAHIAWGTISIREIYQYCRKRRPEVPHKKSLDQFMARLKWRCHFVQKLEMEPSIEFHNLNPSFNVIRTKVNKSLVKAWRQGMTGYPLIDAAMRCVQHTGYLNFRLRSTLVSFLTHHLWQPWQEGARHLARLFIDYEPGIHFSQFQMQAGTMGIHTIRIYNPVKQSKEKDREGTFIRRWLPELENLPTEFLHEPWKMTEMDQIMYQLKLGTDYPRPIVDHEKSARFARETLWQIKKSSFNKQAAVPILDKHTRRPKKRSFEKRR